jgi:putative transposase
MLKKMIVIKGYKTELKLNNHQRTACVKHCGAARFAYNWGLRQKIQAYQGTGKSPSAIDLHKQLNVLKQGNLSWMYEVSKCAPQEALRDLDKAYANFFRRVKQGDKEVGFPKFKSRKYGLGSFRLTGSIKVFERSIQLPRLGKLRLKEMGYIPTCGVKILSATVSEQAGRWFVSVQIEQHVNEPLPNSNEVIGVDLGIKAMATCSNGLIFDNPKPLKAKTKQLKRWQQRLSRRVKGSQNRKKAQLKVARLHAPIAHIRSNALHQATSKIIAQKPQSIVLEDLNIKGMVKNHKLARAISDVGMGEFGRQIAYKSAWQGITVIYAARWFPSSKRCSHCGSVKLELSLAERSYHCEFCGLTLARDLNAAMNLKNTVSSTGINACGESVSPDGLRRFSAKQELNIVYDLVS